EDTLASVFATFAEAFPYVKIFTMTSDMIIVGSATPLEMDSAQLQYLFDQPEVFEELQGITISTPESLLSHEMPLVPRYFSDSQLHTLDFPVLSYKAGIDFFKNETFTAERFVSVLDYRPWANSALLKIRESFP